MKKIAKIKRLKLIKKKGQKIKTYQKKGQKLIPTIKRINAMAR